MSLVLSRRNLKFYNNKLVFEPDHRQRGNIPGDGYDTLRYLMGLIRTKTNDVVELDGRPAPSVVLKTLRDLPGVTVRGRTVEIDEATQFAHRLPFWKIHFGRPTEGVVDEGSAFKRFTTDITLYVRNISWLIIFYSEETLSEFFERGDFEGSAYRKISTGGGLSLEDRVAGHYIRRAEETMRTLGIGYVRPLLTVEPRTIEREGTDFLIEEQLIEGFPASEHFSEICIETAAQVPETQLRALKDEVSTMKFLIEESYNYLSRPYEFGRRAPINKDFRILPEKLLPSVYATSVLYALQARYDEELAVGTTEALQRAANINATGARILAPMILGDSSRFNNIIDGENPLSSLNFPREFFEKYGQKVKSKKNDELTSLSEEFDRAKYVIVEQELAKRYSRPGFFPIYNKITITDAPSNTNIITRALVNSSIQKPILLRIIDAVRNKTNAKARIEAVLGTEIPETENRLIFTLESYDGRPSTSRIDAGLLDIDFESILNSTNFPIAYEAFAGGEVDNKSQSEIDAITADLQELNDGVTTPYISSQELVSTSILDPVSFASIVQDLSETMEQVSRDALITPKELFLGEKNNFFEPIAYEVERQNVTSGEKQHFLLANGEEEALHFFDSQVKFNQEYNYKLTSFNFILENRYYYDSPSIDRFVSGIENFGTLPEGERFVFGTTLVSYQSPRILELPMAAERSVVVDAPPIRPNVEFFATEGKNNKVQIRLSSMKTTELSQPVVVEEEDRQLFVSIRNSQKNFTPAPILFSSDEPPVGYEVFRLETLPESVREFAGNKMTVRSVTAEDKASDGTMFEHAIRPNQDYYYMFRTLDFHGKVSNPTDIFHFKLIDDQGAIVPHLKTIPISSLGPKLSSQREMRRFLEIKPSIRQVSMPESQFRGKTSDDISSVKVGTANISNTPGQSILQSTFIVELKSKKTGKSIYINVDYSLNNDNVRNPQIREASKKGAGKITEKDLEAALRRRDQE